MFILYEHSPKSLRLRDRSIIPATIFPYKNSIPPNRSYIGSKSGVIISLLQTGGFIKADAAVRDAWFLSRAMPATLDESAVYALDGEVFVPVDQSSKITFVMFSEIILGYWPDSLRNAWISASFETNDERRCAGWFRLTNTGREAALINDRFESVDSIRVKSVALLFNKYAECICNGAEIREVWRHLPDGPPEDERRT